MNNKDIADAKQILAEKISKILDRIVKNHLGMNEYDDYEVKPFLELVMAEKEKMNKYVIPMVEVNNKLKQEYDRGRLDEAKNILRIGRENDGVNLVWLAARRFLLEEELKQPQTSSPVEGVSEKKHSTGSSSEDCKCCCHGHQNCKPIHLAVCQLKNH